MDTNSIAYVTEPQAEPDYYCEFANVYGKREACIQGGVSGSLVSGVSISINCMGCSISQHMSPDEARAIAAHLVAAADRFDAIYGGAK